MVAPRSFLVVICAVLVVLTDCAPTQLSSVGHNNATEEVGGYSTATIAPIIMAPSPPSNDGKPWSPQKPSRSKHITKSNLYKKPTKDKGGRAKQQAEGSDKALYSPTLVTAGYDGEKNNFSHHKEPSSTANGNMNGSTSPIDSVVDNVNGPKDYTNKNGTNFSTQQQFIPESISTNVDDNDTGKDIDFISVAGTTKADETYATVSTTEGYHAKAGVATASTTATMQTGLVENPNFNAEPVAKTSTKSPSANDDVQNIKSIFSPTVVPTLAHGKSLPVNASVSSSLSLSFSQQHSVRTTAVPKLDVGHDGVKVTKKKQLFDKHFIAATGPSSPDLSGSLHPSITKDNPWPLSKNKPNRNGKKLMEVPNGYLGPIMMKEKTFSVSHHGKKPKPSIVEQLRDKKLVEIIAPTALMEPTIKVKNSIPPPPEFVAIDNAASPTTSTTTEGTSAAPTYRHSIPTAATTKDKEIESETATTYFLVVTQDATKGINGESGKVADMEPMNATEIETTLREIYTEVLNAIEGASRKTSTATEPRKLSEEAGIKDVTTTEASTNSENVQTSVSNLLPLSDISHQRSSDADHLVRPVTDRLNDHSATTVGDDLFSSNSDLGRFFESDHLIYPDPDQKKRPESVDHATPSEGDPMPSFVADHAAITSTERPFVSDHVKSTGMNLIQSSKSHHAPPSAVDQQLKSTTDHQSQEPTSTPTIFDASSTKLPSLSKAGENQSQIKFTVPTINDHISTSQTIDDSTASTSSQSLGNFAETSTPTTSHTYPPTSIGISTTNLAPTTHDISTTNGHSSTTSPMIHHDLSAGTSSIPLPITDMSTSTNFPITTTISDPNPTFATITTNSYTSSSIPQQHHLKPTYDNEQTESKISDIQIEVYDSTVEPIVASTNFKDNTDGYYPSSHATTTKQSPSNILPQERFTQYVVDKAADFATQDSNTVAKASGKPEPAAIEIHINVSEGFGNESEDLEFSYRQSDYRKVTSKKPANTNFITLKPFDTVPQNETSNEAGEEIVVEIIDGNTNSTENSASRENLNVNPIFTFRSDDDSQVELKNVKYYPEDRPKEAIKSTDDFFVPHLGQQPPGANKPIVDRDSDTIFYISNTEVKVGESLPTTNTYDAQMKKLENQFFPANYEEHKKVVPQRYEEDIILSPLKNRQSDPLKVVRGPLDISYVGESVMDVEQVTVTTTIPPSISVSTPDVIIQPAVLPEMAIGVPVIGELPPQIELKEIDFMPNFDGNKEESSIQYGGDLIDEGGAMSGGFDMDSYPLGNLGMGDRNDAISSQIVLNHRVNHLKKDELTADLTASSETADGNDLLRRSNDSVNGTIIGEKMGNATAYSVMEEPPAGDGEMHFTDLHTLFTACFATLLPLVLSLVMAFGLRHLYRKYQTNPFNVMGRNSSTDPLDAEKGAGGDGDADGVDTPDELRTSSLAFGGTTDSPSLEIYTNPNEVNGKASEGDGRDCNGGVANGRAASDMDVNCIQAIIADDVREENATFIVNCNIEAQPAAPPTIPPQSATIVSNAAAAVAPVAASTPTAGTMQCNYSGANGSITTMTLKNNHLIVETEERNDISRDARETKMHYNNSVKDGVFVVEVSRGADSKIMPGSPVADPADKRHFNIDIQNEDEKLMSNHEAVQIHPPPSENVNIHDEIESNHLHQIDEVDEFEEGAKITKHSNTGLSQSDLSSTSSVDSNKRYSYGNQELYTIEQQDYTTPSPAATKAPHPHTEPQPPQPENHNDDNGHSENGHCLENGPPTVPNGDSIYPAETDADVNGHSGVESKPKITAALLKQDTVIVNEMTNGAVHNGNEDDEETPRNSMENLSNGQDPVIKTYNTVVDYGGDTENGFDSIISLPDPPSTEEMKQMNDIILMETNQLDSLPPPPPPGAENHLHHNGNGRAPMETENGECLSILSSTSPMDTPTKLVKASAPPTITVATAISSSSLAPADIPHTNGNCMTGHTTTATAAVVEVSGSS